MSPSVSLRGTWARSSLVWAWLESGRAHLMVTLADEPVVPAQQAVLFYVYTEEVPRLRDALLAAGVAAGEISYPFYNPRGEFCLTDPDGYVVMVAHT